MRVVPIPVREDNYAYILIDQASRKAAAVDPYDVPKVTAIAQELGVQIVATLTTHHHFDHSGGNKLDVGFEQLSGLRIQNSSQAARYPSAVVYGGSDQVPALSRLVKDNDEFTIGDNTHIRLVVNWVDFLNSCLATPCHTQDSICYYVTDKTKTAQPGCVFTGDTLFIAGSGRFFEGTGDEMNRALKYLSTLPDSTIVYNGHEYTAGNLAFAKSVDPTNSAVLRLEDLVKKNHSTTGLTTIGDEKEWNVFMRLTSDAVRSAAGALKDTPENQIMDALRNKKNNFRG
ncbi:hypothetical protein H0H93_005480 [Arthromyces matolae]|nr:hypothetical protein H0H93_005480 [Arthromyces matolae]